LSTENNDESNPFYLGSSHVEFEIPAEKEFASSAIDISLVALGPRYPLLSHFRYQIEVLLYSTLFDHLANSNPFHINPSLSHAGKPQANPFSTKATILIQPFHLGSKQQKYEEFTQNPIQPK